MLGEDGASDDKKLWGCVCASGPPISKNHAKTSPHGAGLGEANNT